MAAPRRRKKLAYDAFKNRWISLKATGKGPYGPGGDVSLGLRCDPKRKLFWAVTQGNGVFALRLDLKSAPAVAIGFCRRRHAEGQLRQDLQPD